MTPGIRPLVAGNWKMNGTGASLNELRAIGHGFMSGLDAETEALICPPATLADARRRGAVDDAGQGRRPGLPRQGKRRAYRRHLGRDAEGRRRLACHRRPFRAPHRPRRDRRHRARQGRSRVAGRHRRHHLHRRDKSRARARRDARHSVAPDRRLGAADRNGAQHCHRLRAGLGDRHRPHADRRRRCRGACPYSRRAQATAQRGIGEDAHPLRRLGQARPTPSSCSRSTMSTARWSAAPA